MRKGICYSGCEMTRVQMSDGAGRGGTAEAPPRHLQGTSQAPPLLSPTRVRALDHLCTSLPSILCGCLRHMRYIDLYALLAEQGAIRVASFLRHVARYCARCYFFFILSA